jgi:hypothetical protein
MKVNITLFCLITVFWACQGKKEVASSTTETPKPSWVINRPVDSGYYIGIGVAQKVAGTDFRGMAKENALSDLASEIRDNVNANSLLYTLEREYKFEQEFRETIRTSTNIDLEDFELVDRWEDSDAYWVYYRLNKADYAAKQREKKETAEALAVDFLAKAESSERDGRYDASIDYYLRGLQALEEFWGEKNEVRYADQLVLVDNSLFSGLKSLLSDLSIKPDNDPELNFNNGFQTEVEIVVTHNRSGRIMEKVPLEYSYQGEYGRIRGMRSTNADGRVIIPIDQASSATGGNLLEIQVNTELLFQPFQSDPSMRKLTEGLRGAAVQLPLRYVPPVVYISSSEKNMNETIGGEPIAAAMTGSFVRKGFEVTDDRESSDVVVEIESNTREGGQSQGFSTARLDLLIRVKKTKSGEEVYKLSKSDIKGVDLDYERAGRKAYRNFTKNIESELMRKLTTDLF